MMENVKEEENYMSTQYEAHLVIGCYLSDLDLQEGMEDWEYWQENLEHLGINWYEESGFIGFEVEENQKLNINSVQALGKVAQKFRHITGQSATVKACLYSY